MPGAPTKARPAVSRFLPLRPLSQALTLRCDKVLFSLDTIDLSRYLVGKKVIVCNYPDGRLEIDENKRLDDMPSIVAQLQTEAAE